MLKKLTLFLLLILLNSSCEDCDGTYYQIIEKEELGNGLCFYRTQSLGTCYVWNDYVYLDFEDSCDVYLLSYIMKRDELYRKYGK